MKNPIKKWISILLILVIQHSQVVYAIELTLVTVENSADTLTSEAVLREAYRQLDIDLEIKKYPAERAIRMAVAGLVDGEVQRIDAVRMSYPSLIQIKPAINYLEAVVFSRSIEFNPAGWESLHPYRIGLIRGIQFAENNTQGLNRHLINTYQSLFRMLESGRLDLAITPRINGFVHIRHSKIQNIRELTPPIARFELFHYLHPKNRNLAEPVSEILSQMKNSGELDGIRNRITLELIGQNESAFSKCLQSQICDDNIPFKPSLPDAAKR